MRNQSGFTLIELMVVVIVMSIMAVGMAQFTAFAFGRQTTQGRQSHQLTGARGNANLLERDITLAGFGQPLGVRAAYSAPSTHARSDELVLVGGPLVGPRDSGWTYVLQASVGQTLTVRCFGKVESGTLVPHPQNDIVLAGATAVPVRIFNFAGQALVTSTRYVQAADYVCTQPGADVDGDGTPDNGMEIMLDASVSVPVGAIVVPMQGYGGVTDATVRYFVYEDKLWRKNSALPAVPVLDNVEAFQVQYGYSATENTQLTWSPNAPWQADRRLRAIRYHIVTAGNYGLGGMSTDISALDFTYTVPVGREQWERSHIDNTIRTPNTNFSHP